MRKIIIILPILLLFACTENSNNTTSDKTDTIVIEQEENGEVVVKDTKQKCDANFEFISTGADGEYITAYLIHNKDSFELFEELGNYRKYDIEELSISKFISKKPCEIHANFYEALVKVVYIVREEKDIVAYHLYYDESIDKLEITELKRISNDEKQIL